MFAAISWLRSLFRRKNPCPLDGLSPEVIAVYEKIYQYLGDEYAQNDRRPEPFRSALLAGPSCDEIPGATGEFGRDANNPIPVNGPLGELIYLSNLLFDSNQAGLFHRLGSIGTLDIYEIVSMDGRTWDLLVLDFYHPRRSRLAPAGYRLADGGDRGRLFYGTNTYVQNFPGDLQDAVGDAHRRYLGIEMAPMEIRLAVERTRFERPLEHAARVKIILTRVNPPMRANPHG